MKPTKFLRVNFYHAKGASAVMSRRFRKVGLGVVLIQELWTNKRKMLGIQTQDCKLFYDEKQSTPRTAVLIDKTVNCYPITEIFKRDIVAVMVEVPTTRGKTEVIMASVYFPGDALEVLPPEINSFVKYCRVNHKSYIIGCDEKTEYNQMGCCVLVRFGE